ncbi:MAG: hypothetical protein JWR69_3248, partial [Pedosphaera sp.]|nr:hypothetical protein [Pedosphaera sp.]
METAYNAAQTARQTAKGLTSTQDAKNAALDLLLSQAANYVENTSSGDKAKAAVNTMTSGLKYWYRVAALGAAGWGAWVKR